MRGFELLCRLEKRIKMPSLSPSPDPAGPGVPCFGSPEAACRILATARPDLSIDDDGLAVFEETMSECLVKVAKAANSRPANVLPPSASISTCDVEIALRTKAVVFARWARRACHPECLKGDAQSGRWQKWIEP